MKPRARIIRSAENLGLLAFGLIGLVVVILLFAEVQPSARLGIQIDREEAMALATTHITAAGVDLRAYTRHNVSFQVDNQYTAFLKAHQATPDQRSRLHRHRPAAYWAVLFIDPANQDQYFIRLTVEGQVFACQRHAPPGLPGANLPRDEAEERARATLSTDLGFDLTDYTLVDAETNRLEKRTDHTFTWAHQEPELAGAERRIRATVHGDKVSSWSQLVQLPNDFQTEFSRRENDNALYGIGQVILVLSAWIIALIVFVLRFRAGEIGLRSGFIIALVALAVMTFLYINTVPVARHNALQASGNLLATSILYFGLGLSIFFSCFMLFTVWMSGESMARETWPEKLRVFDGLFAQCFFFPDLGRSILRGFSLGLGYLGLWYLVVWGLLQSPDRWAVVSVSETQAFSSFLPLGLPTIMGSLTSLLATTYAFLFTLSFLKQRLKRTSAAVLITLLLFSPLFAGTTLIYDHLYTSLAGLLVGIVVFLFFLRYDLFTVLVGEMVFGAVPVALMFVWQPNVHFQIAGGIGLGVLTVLLVYGYLARTLAKPLDLKAIEPRYVRYISERERMKLELDIARRAQLRMLPRTIPKARGLDIAAFTEPAREVGGDYFDFFPLSDDRLGIAVGDVSGKGMPAALYMTMLKGFLQSRADADTSPKAVLSHVNRKFYQVAEPNIFVTLLYCVLDLSENTLTFARAGHNPLLIYRPSEQLAFLHKPPGLGIGLEEGEIFDRVIQEESFSLRHGDTILLYTDGLTEARNAQAVEFGEEQIIALVKNAAAGTAEELLQHIRNAYFTFVGHQEAHDDLTCMVIKVT